MTVICLPKPIVSDDVITLDQMLPADLRPIEKLIDELEKRNARLK